MKPIYTERDITLNVNDETLTFRYTLPTSSEREAFEERMKPYFEPFYEVQRLRKEIERINEDIAMDEDLMSMVEGDEKVRVLSAKRENIMRKREHEDRISSLAKELEGLETIAKERIAKATANHPRVLEIGEVLGFHTLSAIIDNALADEAEKKSND